jgi:hypothetical protein
MIYKRFLHSTSYLVVTLIVVSAPGTSANAQSVIIAANSKSDAWPVSLSQLIVNPRKYNGKRVRLQGYFLYRVKPFYNPPMPEGELYLTKELADYKSYSDGLLINLTGKNSGKRNYELDSVKKFDKTHVVVEGVFRHYFDPSRFANGLDAMTIESLEK